MSPTTETKQTPSPWEERFGWYHYTGKAVYELSQKDLEETAKRYSEAGITAVILFGAHFRFSFWAYWSDIEDFITRLTKAFHKIGIKVIEHHSSHLTYKPLEEDFWKKRETRGDFVGFLNFPVTSQSNPVLGGENLDSFAQIDGSTGKPCLSSYIHTEGKNMDWIFRHYNGNAHCFNHPAYEKAYWGHVRNIIEKAGVDGMMNDDVQWFGGGNACACEYCRKKFKEETGFDLPYPEDWEGFYENYENPEYIAWKKFKKKSSGDFHRRMDERYASIGYRPLRPAYCAEVIPFDTTCYGFEAASELWDYIFQECCGIIKHSYICFAAEAVHRYALAQRKGVPSMALLYPRTQDSVYASWALCRSWGQLYTGTGSWEQIYSVTGEKVGKSFEKPYRDFEKTHETLFKNPKKQSDASFYFSEYTRDYADKNSPQKYMKPYLSFLESAYVSGISSDMVFGGDDIETLLSHRVIILPYIAMISDKEAVKLREAAKNGATLIVIGPFAEKRENSSPRPFCERLKLLGLKSALAEEEYIGAEEISGTIFKHAISNVVIKEPKGEVIAKGEHGEALAVKESVGKGSVIYHPADVSFHPIQPAVWVKEAKNPADRSFVGEMREGNGRLLKTLLGKQVVFADDGDILSSLFKVRNGFSVHLVNTKDMLPSKDTIASTADVIPAFSEEGGKTASFNVFVGLQKGVVSGAVLYSPEFEGGVKIDFDFSENKSAYRLKIPGGVFSGYGLLHIKV
ncbi:MAG: hypothetical protein WC143_04010 [Eubacteriales bacterium]